MVEERKQMEMRSCYLFLVGHDGHESKSKKLRGKDLCNRDEERREKTERWRERKIRRERSRWINLNICEWKRDRRRWRSWEEREWLG